MTALRRGTSCSSRWANTAAKEHTWRPLSGAKARIATLTCALCSCAEVAGAAHQHGVGWGFSGRPGEGREGGCLSRPGARERG
jgi:hypothetical protein